MSINGRLCEKRLARDLDRKRCQAFLLVGDKAYSGAPQPTMKLAVSFIYWAIEVRLL